jgi:hypothetical protein
MPSHGSETSLGANREQMHCNVVGKKTANCGDLSEFQSGAVISSRGPDG